MGLSQEKRMIGLADVPWSFHKVISLLCGRLRIFTGYILRGCFPRLEGLELGAQFQDMDRSLNLEQERICESLVLIPEPDFHGYQKLKEWKRIRITYDIEWRGNCKR